MYRQKMALPVVIGRIVAVSGMGLAAAIAILAFVGGLWVAGLVAVGRDRSLHGDDVPH